MSIAGVRSEAGDAYQIMVAAHWAIQMLLDKQIEKIEVNTTSLDDTGQPIAVDDVVIYRTDGSAHYCQCKKNQTDFKAWNVTDLAGELINAGRLLAGNVNSTVYFYSRNNFGDTQKLQEYANAFPDEASFLQDLSKDHRATHDQLANLWQKHLLAAGASVRAFLSRIVFETTGDVAVKADEQRRTLGQTFTVAGLAYTKLLERLNQISSRTKTSGTDLTQAQVQSLYRSDLLALLAQAGSTQTPNRAEADLAAAFAATSAVGRHWQRTIGHARLPRQALDQLLADIETQPQSLLVTDGPGFGKTCLLLDLVERLEAQSSRACLFIQAREFAACTNDAERRAQGLLDDPLGSIARMAEFRHTVVVIDSLDVLSLSQGQGALNYFLSLIDRLQNCPNVTVVAACRGFDLQYDRRLADRQWSKTVLIGALDWEQDVCPLLASWQISAETVPKPLQGLLTNPRLLALFWEITSRGGQTGASSAQELTDHYLATVVSKNPTLGDVAMSGIEHISKLMLEERRLDLPQKRANLPEALIKLLLSEGILTQPRPGLIAFGHQTLLDVLVVNAAERAHETLLQFITRQHATPFIRPAIRTFFFQLRMLDTRGFRGQVRAVLDADGVAYHLKRLLVESLIEIVPEDEDWPLVQYLFRAHLPLFQEFRWRARGTLWANLLIQHWVPLILAEKNAEEVLFHVRFFQLETAEQVGLAVQFWLQAMQLDWMDKNRLAQSITIELSDCKYWPEPRLATLLRLLMATGLREHRLFGKILADWVTDTDSGDELLWQYIISSLATTGPADWNAKNRLRCDPKTFHDHDFLARRMGQSSTLLELALAATQQWSDQLTAKYEKHNWTRHQFLDSTPTRFTENVINIFHIDGLEHLLAAVEYGCLSHAANNPDWWQRVENQLRTSSDYALQYMALRVYTKQAAKNLPAIIALLASPKPLDPILWDELGQLIAVAVPLLNDAQQEQLQLNVLHMYHGAANGAAISKEWEEKKQSDLLRLIPACRRLPPAQSLIDRLAPQYADHGFQPVPASDHSNDYSPISPETILQLTDHGIAQLLGYRGTTYRTDNGQIDHKPVADRVYGQWGILPMLREAATKAPRRFLHILTKAWPQLDHDSRETIFGGAGEYLLSSRKDTANQMLFLAEKPDELEVARLLLEEIERHSPFWHHKRETIMTLKACAALTVDAAIIDRITFQVTSFRNAKLPEQALRNLRMVGISSAVGVAAETATILATQLAKTGQPLPDMVSSTLRSFARISHPAIGAAILAYLPNLQYYESALSWEIFDQIVSCGHPGIWQDAERYLYSCYRNDFARVAPHLAIMALLIDQEDTGETWGRITTLASLDGKVPPAILLEKLQCFQSMHAWRGAVTVFAANIHFSDCQEICRNGILAALQTPDIASAIVELLDELFDGDNLPCNVPPEILRGMFAHGTDFPHFPDWLLARVDAFPDEVLNAIEIMLAAVEANKPDHMYLDKKFTQVLTRLFREAEEREQTDQGQFLVRVIAIQNLLSKHNLANVQEWLSAAERP
jgi:hypothetical protein